MVRKLGAIVGSPTVKNGGDKAVQPLRHDAPQALAIAGQGNQFCDLGRSAG